MREFQIVTLLAVLFFWCAPASGHHGPGHHRGGCSGCGDTDRHHTRHCPNCENTSAVVTLSGTIDEVSYRNSGSASVVEVKLRTESGNEWVRLAPAMFLKKSGVTLSDGQTITVKGVRVYGGNGDLTVAHELTTESQTITLRDRAGRGRW